MKAEVGLWIDRKKTVIVTGEGEEIVTLESNLEKDVKTNSEARGKTAFGAINFPAEDQQDRRFALHLNKYYSKVIEHLRGADAVVIFGPGEAKFELEKRFEHEGLKVNILGIETADKLTTRQFTAKVKQFFANKKLPAH
jgi:hypothetical protein